MAQTDSIDKIVMSYFSIITNEKFEYKKKIYFPKAIKISPLIFRDYTCPENCGGCCPRFSLDYLPDEKRPSICKKRVVNFNGKDLIIFSDVQNDHNDYHCRNLIKSNARCYIHKERPFSCDFELIRSLTFKHQSFNVLTQKTFGRGWQMKRIDNERGALCKITPCTEESINEVIRKLKRLKQWSDYFGLNSKIDLIINWCKEVKPFIIKNYPVKSILIK